MAVFMQIIVYEPLTLLPNFFYWYAQTKRWIVNPHCKEKTKTCKYKSKHLYKIINNGLKIGQNLGHIPLKTRMSTAESLRYRQFRVVKVIFNIRYGSPLKIHITRILRTNQAVKTVVKLLRNAFKIWHYYSNDVIVTWILRIS